MPASQHSQDSRDGFHSPSTVTATTERLLIDFVGPIASNMRGNIGIVVVVNSFSKFVSFCTVRKMMSVPVSDYLGRRNIPAFGLPNLLCQTMLWLYIVKFSNNYILSGVSKISLTPYYLQPSLADRLNRNLKAALKIFHHESQNTWDVNVPWLGLAFNTAVHGSTRYTRDV